MGKLEIKSKVSGEVLHIIFRMSDFRDGRIDIIEPHNHLQCAAMAFPAGQAFRPHKHIYKKGPESIIAQESWVVIAGRVMCVYYDIDNTIIATEILEAGDASFTLSGGHTYRIIDDAFIYEMKIGPYDGAASDKEFI